MTWKILSAISMWKDTPYLGTENIKICGRITKLEAIRMQSAGIFFHSGWIFVEICTIIFPRYCSNIIKVRWAMWYGFCSKFHTLSSSAKNFKNVLRFDSYRKFKGGNFFWDTVWLYSCDGTNFRCKRRIKELPSIGLGADPGPLAVSPQVTYS